MLPLFPTDSVTLTVVGSPVIVTVDLTPEPVPPAVKLRTVELAPFAETGSVYVSFVSLGKVTV